MTELSRTQQTVRKAMLRMVDRIRREPPKVQDKFYLAGWEAACQMFEELALADPRA